MENHSSEGGAYCTYKYCTVNIPGDPLFTKLKKKQYFFPGGAVPASHRQKYHETYLQKTFNDESSS